MFSVKKLLLIGFVAILLITIPVTMYVLQQSQDVRSKAQASTALSYAPPSTVANPLQATVGETVNLDVMVNPNENAVSFVRLEIQYDPAKLGPAEAPQVIFEQNKVAFPVTNQPPVTEDGKIIVSVAVQQGDNTGINTLTKVGTLHLKALATTDTPTQVLYGIQTEVLSEGGGDQASENILSPTGKTPAIIEIVAGTTPSPSISPTESPTPTEVTPTMTTTPTPSASPTATPTPTSDPNNALPSCVSLTADVASGAAPLIVNFTAVGSDTNGTVEKVTFNTGDGNVTSVTDNLSTASVSALLAHTYTSGGTFTASAIMTDNSGGSSTSNCNQTIIVAGPTATPAATITDTPTPTAILDTPTPTLASPGPGGAIIGLGAFFTVLSLIGAIMFFAL